MPLTDFEKVLFARAREYVNAGRLPRAMPKEIWAGSGAGRICSLCHETIGREHIEYEFAEPERVRFHLRCHAIWQLAASDGTDGDQSRVPSDIAGW